MSYEVWVRAHNPRTMVVIAETLICVSEDRLLAEKRAEQEVSPISDMFGPYVLEQQPVITTETRAPSWGRFMRVYERIKDQGPRLRPEHGSPYGSIRCECGRLTALGAKHCYHCGALI